MKGSKGSTTDVIDQDQSFTWPCFKPLSLADSGSFFSGSANLTCFLPFPFCYLGLFYFLLFQSICCQKFLLFLKFFVLGSTSSSSSVCSGFCPPVPTSSWLPVCSGFWLSVSATFFSTLTNSSPFSSLSSPVFFPFSFDWTLASWLSAPYDFDRIAFPSTLSTFSQSSSL